ncbi:uncharacterized protein LOC124144893 isoform X2 [Haliotis rufescens]|uniref:uncharacterized protein LOC124144893 isoform X2 n=1 Tax=Haliotis rufescens TaxID=6454 RepID=UPI00201E99F0|nr:uncharacterized protein LOC124144893 isoform X2 [Haliotis rufescens]
MNWFLIIVLLVSSIHDFIAAECHCNTITACTEFPSTPCSQVGSPDRCQDGWFGPYCQKQNVARGRPANQTSTYGEYISRPLYKYSFTAEHAVDGGVNTGFYSEPYTCSHTLQQMLPMWTVYLNTSSTERIHHIKLYLRHDHRARDKGMQILVGEQMCYNWSQNVTPSSVVDVTCRQPLAGNKVTIQIPRRTFVTLCEVLIFVCSDGWFGDDCEQECNCLNSTETCDKITGACSSGCRPGFNGTDCLTLCSDGWFGDGCGERCNCLNSTETCDKITGACSSGCRPGFNGTDCQTLCPDGFYGTNCALRCGNCINDVKMCNRSTGACPRGCTAGWLGETCLQSCSVGMYGVNCTSECQHCLNFQCNNRDGSCIDGCIGNFSMPLCQDCLSTHYGEACNETCGKCQGNTPCERLSGECPGGCLSGYDQTDLICRTEAQSQSPVAVIPIVGGGIAVMLVIAVFLAAVVIYRRRRRITEDKGEPEIHKRECLHSQYDVITMVESSTSGEQLHVYANEGPPLDDGHAGAFHEPSLDDGSGRALPRPQLDDTHAGALHEPPLDGGSGRALPRPLLDDGRAGALHEPPLDDRSGRALPRPQLDDGHAGALHEPPLDDRSGRALPRPQLDDGRAGALHEPPLDHGSGRALPRPQLDDDPSWANSGPLLDADDEDAMFSVETDVDVDTEAAATYYNWIPPHMMLDKLPQCIMDKKKKSFEVEFQAIPYGARRPHVVGKRPENKKKNRFVALYSYDHSRVVLTEGADDYINANYIKGHDDNLKYIATQGPTPVTITDFWQMIWQENVTEIVMLTNLMEKKKKKCEQYWPAEYESDCYGDFSITNKKAVARADYTTATFLVRKSTEERVVRHFHFTSWPDHGVPSAPALVNFWRMVKQEGAKGRPMVIHCSAGVGRTGTFIALDHLMDEAENENKVNVFMCVSKMREDRMNMVQTMSQYEFVHDVVLEAIRSRGTFFTSPEFEKEFGQGKTFTDTQETKLRKQFQLLQESTSRLSEETVSTALLPQNAAKNRSRTILPGNKTRPHLTTRVHQRNNYINAVVLSSILRPSSLIVTQTPLPDTVVDFWRLVYDHDCCTVICLDHSKEVENVYPKENQNFKKGPFTIVLEKENSNREGYTERSLTVLYDKGCERSVVVFSLKSRDMMSHPATLLELVNSVHMVITSADHKVLVHCHDGASVSGVFCSVLNIISRLRLDRDVDIFLSIRELQCVRPQFIQSFEDYQLCYSIVKEYNRDASIYANV